MTHNKAALASKLGLEAENAIVTVNSSIPTQATEDAGPANGAAGQASQMLDVQSSERDCVAGMASAPMTKSLRKWLQDSSDDPDLNSQLQTVLNQQRNRICTRLTAAMKQVWPCMLFWSLDAVCCSSHQTFHQTSGFAVRRFLLR